MPKKNTASEAKAIKRAKQIRTLLAKLAVKARKFSYSPYSKYPVGAAVLCPSGKVYTGCNIENSSYGLSNCAERTAIFKAISSGERKILALAVAAKSSTPCGACRQVISEFADPEAEIILVDIDPKTGKKVITVKTVEQMLPLAFNPTEAGL